LAPSFAALLSSSFPVGALLSMMAVLLKRSASTDLVLSVGAVLGRSIFLDVSAIDAVAGGRADTATL
jgi:hypothetical protein